MTRESPSLLGSSELRDVRLQPSAVRAANVTIIHPQLRDLVLPLARGHVLYPRGTAIEEARWTDDDDDDDEYDVVDSPPAPSPLPPRSGAGRSGVSGQATARTLFKLGFTPTCLTSSGAILACGGQKGELFMCDLPTGDRVQRVSPVKPFALSLNLPSHSINNAITILPSYPYGWTRRQAEVKRLYGQREPRQRDIDFEDDDESTLRDSDDDDEDADTLDDDMDIDDESASGGAQVLTYPNSIPFGHARRIPIVAGDRNRRWSNTTSISSQSPQYVTSHGSARHRSPASSSETSRRSRMQRADEPRILVSNNDQTVKMFSLRRLDRERERDQEAAAEAHARVAPAVVNTRYQDYVSHTPLPPARTLFGSSYGYDSIGLNEGILAQPPQVVPEAREHTRARYTSNVGNLPYTAGGSWSRYRDRTRDIRNLADTPAAQDLAHRAWEQRQVRPSSGMLLDREIEDSEVEPRKLTRVGGTKFKLAVNHSSLSPDLRTMVTVGDSTEVFIYEVLDGGREFRRIGVYSAATDYGFSTAWSKDGRKFAVASQDGQVTVWDHRTSKPLAIFHSSPSVPSGTDSVASSPVASHVMEAVYEEERPQVLIDPVTGDPRLGSSTSGRDAARVVKFSPEGSSRDLLVFSEENYNIHIIDARTFNTHVVVPVPYDPPPPFQPAPRRHNRHGVDGGTWGISGVAFDPTGDWLYAGTERTIVEWDMRRYGGGEGGTWAMA